jgi:hypothetical protein
MREIGMRPLYVGLAVAVAVSLLGLVLALSLVS